MPNENEHLQHLEATLEQLRIQNLLLSSILKGVLHGLPSDIAQEVAESVRYALEDEAGRLEYEAHPLADYFHEAAEDFFRSTR